MNIFMIGGTNFIGPTIAKELSKAGHKMTLFHRSKGNGSDGYSHIQGDCRNVDDLRSAIKIAKPDVIIHMIAYFQSDVTTLEQALDGRAIQKTIIISSGDVYKGYEVLTKLSSANIVPVPFTEESPLRNVLYPYRGKLNIDIAHDYDKIVVERAALRSPLLHAVILRLGMVYGENDPNHRFADPIRKMTSGAKSIEITQESIHFRASKCYVGNIAHGVALAVMRGQIGEVYNLADRVVFTESEWLELLSKKLNWNGTIITADKEIADMNLKQHFVLSTDKIRKALGYKEIFSVDHALSNTISWELSQLEPGVR